MKALFITLFAILHLNSHAQKTEVLKPGPQGGGMKVVQNYHVELVNSISRVSVYLYDRSMNPVSNDGVLGDITFCYGTEDCLNKTFVILGKNGYTVNLVDSHFKYCEITLIINGKPLNVKFNNTPVLAESK